MKFSKYLSLSAAFTVLTISSLAQAELCKHKLFLLPLKKSIYLVKTEESMLRSSQIRTALVARGYNNFTVNQSEADLVLDLNVVTNTYRYGIMTEAYLTIHTNGTNEKVTDGDGLIMESDADYGSHSASDVFTSEKSQIKRAIQDAITDIKHCPRIK